jgi:hypothetical protein
VLSAYAFLADMTGVSQTLVVVLAPTRGKAPTEFPARLARVRRDARLALLGIDLSPRSDSQ